jgi:hypothetical protein
MNDLGTSCRVEASRDAPEPASADGDVNEEVGGAVGGHERQSTFVVGGSGSSTFVVGGPVFTGGEPPRTSDTGASWEQVGMMGPPSGSQSGIVDGVSSSVDGHQSHRELSTKGTGDGDLGRSTSGLREDDGRRSKGAGGVDLGRPTGDYRSGDGPYLPLGAMTDVTMGSLSFDLRQKPRGMERCGGIRFPWDRHGRYPSAH